MATQTQQPIITGANGQIVPPRNDAQLQAGNFPEGSTNPNTFDVPEINNMTNQTGVIPADQIVRNPRVTIPQTNLSQTAPDATQALSEGEQQVQAQTTLQQLTARRIADQTAQRQEQSALVSAIGGNAQEIQSLFNQNEAIIAPIEQEVEQLNGLIQAKTSALRQQLIDESGRPIPQAFITGRKALIQQRASAEIADLGALLDAKNGQMQLAEQKLDRSLNIMREVNNAEIEAQQVKIDLLKEITGDSKEEEQKELDRLKEEQLKREQAQKELKNLVIQNAGLIPTRIAQEALMNPDSEDALQKIMPYLGVEQRLNVALKQAQLASERNALSISKQTAEELNLKDLDNTEREDLNNARVMSKSMDRMQELIDSTENVATLFSGVGSPEAREFAQIKANVIDVLARDRTGAVIGKDEARSFRKILGAGAFTALTASDKDELKSIISRTQPQFDSQITTIDPSGNWVSYLDEKNPLFTQEDVEQKYNEQSTAVPGDIIQANGISYRVNSDGTVTEI